MDLNTLDASCASTDIAGDVGTLGPHKRRRSPTMQGGFMFIGQSSDGDPIWMTSLDGKSAKVLRFTIGPHYNDKSDFGHTRPTPGFESLAPEVSEAIRCGQWKPSQTTYMRFHRTVQMLYKHGRYSTAMPCAKKRDPALTPQQLRAIRVPLYVNKS